MLHKSIRKLNRWLKNHEPVFCALCLRLIFKKDATYNEMMTGRIVPLCQKCHNEIFHPYSDTGEKQ
jgi:RNase P subunit RPR2